MRTSVGYVEKLADEKLAKRAHAQKVEGKWRRGRQLEIAMGIILH